jgi:hypothetical protein
LIYGIKLLIDWLILQGPLELTLDAMKLVSVGLTWLAADQRTAASRQSVQLWQEPRLTCLQLKNIEQLTVCYAHISAPR